MSTFCLKYSPLNSLTLILLNFLNLYFPPFIFEIVHYQSLGYQDENLVRQPTDQTSQMYRMAWLYTGGKGYHFGFQHGKSKIRVSTEDRYQPLQLDVIFPHSYSSLCRHYTVTVTSTLVYCPLLFLFVLQTYNNLNSKVYFLLKPNLCTI